MMRIFLHFSDKDRHDTAVLALLAVICAATLFIMQANNEGRPATEEKRPEANADTTRYRNTDKKQTKTIMATKPKQDKPGEAKAKAPQRIYPKKFEQPTLVDPNTADTIILQRIPGIGRWTAKSIVEHRDKLGGFHSTAQLMEARHFSEDALEWFAIDTATVDLRKININDASFHQLNRHPYISYEQTKQLQSFLRLYGRIADIDALSRTDIFSEEEIERLKPYVVF